ncbi:MAG: PD-(D/E)XK nuclease family protein [Oscillospiraceae bacterium]|nr:PD-(D/E)XK nuclease family protein [Oscillospiraceae bacterium]
MLKLVISPPGTGKTAYITEQIRTDTAHSVPILIVPEQSHFETERAIYKKLGARAFASTEILSFTKLAANITAKYEADAILYAEDTMREITMFKAVRELLETLVFYSNSAQKPDFAAQMLKTIGLFQREAVSPQELSESAAEIKSARLKAKTTDLARIYERYSELLSAQSFSDKQDETRVAVKLARENNYFAGKSIFIDSFDGFTGGQFKLLEIALEQAASLTITLTADKIDSVVPKYITSAKLAQKLKEAAEKRRIKVDILTPKNYLPERDCGNQTEIYFLPDIYAESNFVAAKIRELITTENYSQRDIAVLNPPSPQTLAGAFSAYGITGFSDIPESVIEKPVVKFIITVLEASAGKAGAFSDLIQSGFMRVSGDVASRKIKVSSQIIQRKIDGKRTADYVPRGKTCRLSRRQIQLLMRIINDDSKQNSSASLENTELLLTEITAKLAGFHDKIKSATGDKITEALADFLLIDLELGRTVADIVYMGKKIDSTLNDEYRELWEKIISIFEAMHSALKDEEISLADYTAFLSSIFAKTMIAKPPQVLDSVTIGDLRRTRTGEVKVVFLMGASQGEFPKSSAVSGMEFTDSETEQLCSAGIFIDENRAERYHRERFLIGRAMSLPTEKLFITAPLKDAARKEKKPSRLILEEQEKIKNAADLPLSFWAGHEAALKFQSAEKPHEHSLKRALGKINPQEFARIFLENNCTHLHKINCETAQLLMKRESISPSRIEMLNTCLFKYFCANGLRISAERAKNETEPDALTRGNLTHFVLEKVLKNHEEFMSMNPEGFEKIVKKYITEFEINTFAFADSPRNAPRSARKKEILLAHAAGIAEVLKQIHEDFSLSDFRPLEFEKEFRFLLGEVIIKGKIDRIDTAENAVRVVDYKTGSKDFNFPEVEYGLNLQALIYLFAAAEMNGSFKPSGAFYRLVNGGKFTEKYKPYGAKNTADDLYKNRLETQKTTGLQFGEIAADVEKINSKMKLNSSTRRDFIKLETLDEKQFALLYEKAANQLTERLSALYSGDVKAVPVYSKTSPCSYCDYKNICNNAGKKEEVQI